MATSAINQSTANPTIWDQTCNAASSAATWIKEGSKSVAASASEAISNLAQFFGYYLNICKEAIVAAKDHFVALPMNVKVVAGIGAVLTAVAGYFLAKWCAPAPVVPLVTPATVVTPAQNHPAAVVTPAAPGTGAAAAVVPAATVVAQPSVVAAS